MKKKYLPHLEQQLQQWNAGSQCMFGNFQNIRVINRQPNRREITVNFLFKCDPLSLRVSWKGASTDSGANPPYPTNATGEAPSHSHFKIK